MSSRVFLAGPMTGIKDFNFPAFDKATEELRDLGYYVYCPAERDRILYGTDMNLSEKGDIKDLPANFNLDEVMSRNLHYIREEADLLVTLPGWSESKGAIEEMAAARDAGIPIRSMVFIRVDAEAQRRIKEEEAQRRMTSEPQAEVRTVSATGGEKGKKLAAYDLISVGPLLALAEHYGRGAKKYSDRNWERGYEWSKSYAACQRHLNAFWGGEDIDPETGSHHLSAAAWHCFTMHEFTVKHPDFDDRPK